MVQSLNAQSDFTCKATWYREGPVYGNLMVGDKAFEFYNDVRVRDYIQIPWDEITYVVADVYFNGKYIPRFEIRTKKNGSFKFAARDARATLKAISKYVPKDRMRKALSMGQILKRRFSALAGLVSKKK